MKLVSFAIAGRPGYGAVKAAGVVDLTQHFAARGVTTLRGLLAAGLLAEAQDTAASAAPDFPLDGLALAPVIPDPDKIICVGLNYRDHVAETGRTETANPALFARFVGSQVGHLQPMVRPGVSEEFDYEGELAVVIGKPGRHVPAAQAMAHVAGYACYNEGSVRDWQRHTSQFLAGKTFAGTGAFGPWLVTADEIPDPSQLTLQTRLNGHVVQSTTTDLMITAIPQLIAYCSTLLPLLPGDVIVTGTPGGVGAKRTPPLWLRPGDVVEVEISGIGCLRNPVVAEAAIGAAAA
jgi:2-keto-4-pentenoate hydratase/2-oxohepta-3-ene-1,7-dioic acid hydratase in catechol pathway